MKNKFYNLGFCLILFFQPFFLRAQNETEPNNDFPAANLVTLVNNAVTRNGTIGHAGDNDYFKFTIPRSGVITASVTNVPANLRMHILLYNESRVLVGQSYYGVGEGVNVNYEQLVGVSGTYYIRLRDAGDDRSNANPYNFTLTLDTTDVYEWNQEFATASPIPYQTTLRGSIRSAGDNDYFKFTIPRSGVITASVTNVPANIRMHLLLYDEHQVLVSQSYYGVGAGITVNSEQLVGKSGIYYLRLRDAGDDKSNSGQYTLTLGLDTTDVYEWNQEFATASPIPYQTTLRGSIRSAGDNDYFKFTIPRSGVITASVTNVPANIRMHLLLYDEHQVLVSQTSPYVGQGITVNSEQLVSKSGIYYLRLRDAGDDKSNSGQYTLTLGLDTTDVYEWNQDFATASPIPYQSTLRGSIRSTGDNDYFKFTIPRSGVITASVTNVPTNIRMHLLLYDEHQVLVSQTSPYVGQGITVNSEQLVSKSGIYYLRLRDAGDDKSNSSQYTLTLGLDTTDVYEWNQDFATATPIHKNICATIRSAGDIDFYKINIPSGGNYAFSVQAPACIALSMTLYNSNNQVVRNMSNANRGGFISFTQNLMTQGLYYLAIHSYYDRESCGSLYCLTLPGAITSTNDYEADANISIVPNPVEKLLSIQSNEPIKTVEIYNLLSQMVLKKEVNDRQLQIDTENWLAGIYVVHFKFENGKVQTQKFLKQ